MASNEYLELLIIIIPVKDLCDIVIEFIDGVYITINIDNYICGPVITNHNVSIKTGWEPERIFATIGNVLGIHTYNARHIERRDQKPTKYHLDYRNVFPKSIDCVHSVMNVAREAFSANYQFDLRIYSAVNPNHYWWITNNGTMQKPKMSILSARFRFGIFGFPKGMTISIKQITSDWPPPYNHVSDWITLFDLLKYNMGDYSLVRKFTDCVKRDLHFFFDSTTIWERYDWDDLLVNLPDELKIQLLNLDYFPWLPRWQKIIDKYRDRVFQVININYLWRNQKYHIPLEIINKIVSWI